jgi:hypothetical protein
MNEDESDLDRRFARLLSGEQDIDDTEAPNDDDSSSGSSYQYYAKDMLRAYFEDFFYVLNSSDFN